MPGFVASKTSTAKLPRGSRKRVIFPQTKTVQRGITPGGVSPIAGGTLGAISQSFQDQQKAIFNTTAP